MNNTAPVAINSGAASAAPSSSTHHGVYMPAKYVQAPITGVKERVSEALDGLASGVRFVSPRSRMGRPAVNRF